MEARRYAKNSVRSRNWKEKKGPHSRVQGLIITVQVENCGFGCKLNYNQHQAVLWKNRTATVTYQNSNTSVRFYFSTAQPAHLYYSAIAVLFLHSPACSLIALGYCGSISPQPSLLTYSTRLLRFYFSTAQPALLQHSVIAVLFFHSPACSLIALGYWGIARISSCFLM